MPERIYLSSPHMGENEERYVSEAFATNWIAPIGPFLGRFENDLATYIGVTEVAALSSGTAALHLALRILGVGQGDEVVCQSFTFAGSANPIVYQGAIPVFVDSEWSTWNMSPEWLEEAIKDRLKKTGKKPSAIIYVHLYGMPAKVDEIVRIAGKYEIPLIEDAAEALGSTYHQKSCGCFGDLSVLSFNGNKIITTSGGGALLSSNTNWIEKARFLATQARDAAPHYQHSEIGYNYRLSNVCAAIGCGQMEVLDERVSQRRAVYDFYQNLLGNNKGISFLNEPRDHFSNRWLTTVLINPEEMGGVDQGAIRKALEKENIESRPLWKPMHLQPVFSNVPFYGDGTSERLFEQGLCLPSGSNMVQTDLEKITKVFDAVL